MNIIIGKINDKLTVPSSMWKGLGLNRGDLVDFYLEHDSVILKKHTEIEQDTIQNIEPINVNIIDNSINLTNKSEDNLIKEFDLVVRKRKLVRIPAEIFNKYDLQYKPYQTSSIECNGKVEITFEKSSHGDLKFRKENELSLGLLESKYNIEIPEGINVKLKSFDNTETFTLVFNSIDIKHNNIDEYKLKSLNDIFERKEKTPDIFYRPSIPITEYMEDKHGNKLAIHHTGICSNYDNIENTTNEELKEQEQQVETKNKNETESKQEYKQLNNVDSTAEEHKFREVYALTSAYKINKEYEPKEVKENQYSDERKLKVNSRHTINIPSDIFIKMRLSNKTYLPICTKDDKNVYISLIVTEEKDKIESNMKYYRTFRNMNTLTLTEATKEFFEEPVAVGTMFTLIYNEKDKSLLFIFDKNDVVLIDSNKKQSIDKIENINTTDNKEQQKQTETTNKSKIILLDESNEPNQKKRQIIHEINTRIKRGDSIKFISKEDLPKNETVCFTCKKELTDEDKSMYKHHRICNQCNRIHLKHFLNPIIELAKLNNSNKEEE